MIQLRHTGENSVARTAVIVAVLLVDETNVLSGAFVDGAALSIHKWTLHPLAILKSSSFTLRSTVDIDMRTYVIMPLTIPGPQLGVGQSNVYVYE